VREFDATILFFYEDHLLLQKNWIEMRGEIPQKRKDISSHSSHSRKQEEKKKRVEQELKAQKRPNTDRCD